jgi:hypothetical protein
LAALTLGLALLAIDARAACSNPTANEGVTLYNYDYHTPQYCNGTNWLAMGGVYTVPWVTSGTDVYYTGGKVGIGTSAPRQKLHISGNVSTYGNTSGLILYKADGATPGYSVARSFGNDDAQNFYIYDNLVNSVRLIVDASGNVGIGTVSPGTKLEVNGTITLPSGDTNAIQGNGASSWLVLGSDAGSTGGAGGTGSHIVLRGSTQSQNIEFYQNANQRFVFYPTGNAMFTGTLTQNSDARLKTDIHVIPDALEKLTLLRGVTFHWKAQDRDRGAQVGVIAQDVQKAFPQLVSTDASGTLNVNYQGLVAPLIEAVKELKADNDNLRADFEAYKKSHP